MSTSQEEDSELSASAMLSQVLLIVSISTAIFIIRFAVIPNLFALIFNRIPLNLILTLRLVLL